MKKGLLVVGVAGLVGAGMYVMYRGLRAIASDVPKTIKNFEGLMKNLKEYEDDWCNPEDDLGDCDDFRAGCSNCKYKNDCYPYKMFNSPYNDEDWDNDSQGSKSSQGECQNCKTNGKCTCGSQGKDFEAEDTFEADDTDNGFEEEDTDDGFDGYYPDSLFNEPEDKQNKKNKISDSADKALGGLNTVSNANESEELEEESIVYQNTEYIDSLDDLSEDITDVDLKEKSITDNKKINKGV